MMRSSEPFHHFVDDYLAYLHEVHPSNATLDGVHAYDDHIEDFSRHAIDQHVRALAGFSRRLQDINLNDLTEVEKAEQPMVASNIQARMFEFEQVRTWERSPQFYSDTLCSSLAAQVVFTHAPLPERARRVLSKLRQTSRLVRKITSHGKEVIDHQQGERDDEANAGCGALWQAYTQGRHLAPPEPQVVMTTTQELQEREIQEYIEEITDSGEGGRDLWNERWIE